MNRRIVFAVGAVVLLALQAAAQPDPTRAMVRADGTLVVDDRATFPVGMHTEDLESIQRIADAGFNLVAGTGEWDAEYYQAARERDLLILGGHYVWATFASFRGGNGIDLAPSEEAGVQNVLAHGRDQSWRMPLDTLQAFDALPNVIGWRTNEEPEAKLVEYMEYAYEIFKSNSPAHLVATLSCDPRWFHAFRNTADVLIIDNYPFRGGAGQKRSVLETYEWVRAGVDAMPGKAVWVMPQLIPPSFWSRNPEDEITLAQMRLQVYAGLVGGAKGVIFYNESMFGQVYERGEDGRRVGREAPEEVMAARWSDLETLVAELSWLGPIICHARPTRDLEILWAEPGSYGPGPQMVRELDLYGEKYLLALNVLDQPLTGAVLGINGGNREGWSAEVWLGESDLSVEGEPEKAPTITVGPRGAGVFRLTRRPIVREEQ